MSYFARFSPTRAFRDLRLFLSNLPPYHWKVMALSAAIVFALFIGFVHDSRWEHEYKPDIIYVEQWPASRSEAEILTQQKIDGAAKTKRLAEEEAERKERQAQFKKVDDKLRAWGF